MHLRVAYPVDLFFFGFGWTRAGHKLHAKKQKHVPGIVHGEALSPTNPAAIRSAATPSVIISSQQKSVHSSENDLLYPATRAPALSVDDRSFAAPAAPLYLFEVAPYLRRGSASPPDMRESRLYASPLAGVFPSQLPRCVYEPTPSPSSSPLLARSPARPLARW